MDYVCRQDGGCPQCNPELAAVMRASAAGRTQPVIAWLNKTQTQLRALHSAEGSKNNMTRFRNSGRHVCQCGTKDTPEQAAALAMVNARIAAAEQVAPPPTSTEDRFKKSAPARTLVSNNGIPAPIRTEDRFPRGSR
jgi:hypothetical protein